MPLAQDLAAHTKYSPFLLAPGGHRTAQEEEKHEEREAPLHLTELPSLRGSGSHPLPRLAHGVPLPPSVTEP